jgi:hypothetical protein
MHKKAQTDIGIIVAVVAMFILIGAFLPYIRQDFDDHSQGNYSVSQFSANLAVEGRGTIATALTTIWSITSMFFWTFGNLPFFVDLLMMIPRVFLMIAIISRLRG